MKRRNGFGSLCLLGGLLAVVHAGTAQATTGPGCLVVVNVPPGDVLNLRAARSASAPVVDVLVPGQHGILHLDGPCSPTSLPWGSRWCPVTHYNGDRTTHGFVKARFVRDSECP